MTATSTAGTTPDRMFRSMIVAAVLIAVLFATGFFSMLAIM
ncbi:MAG: hypothetical protein V8Q42_11920 [Anaerovoracaceae bacterium]